MKIYTRSGDDGSTSLFGGGRMAKSDIRICSYGTIDELNALLGMVRTEQLPPRLDDVLKRLQNQLFDLGAELASPQAADRGTEFLQEEDVVGLEKLIDVFEAKLPKLTAFILPGGNPAAATLHLARCVCRRAEREIVALSQETAVRETILRYVNRLSDLLFVLARTANAEEGVEDVPWQKGQDTQEQE